MSPARPRAVVGATWWLAGALVLGGSARAATHEPDVHAAHAAPAAAVVPAASAPPSGERHGAPSPATPIDAHAKGSTEAPAASPALAPARDPGAREPLDAIREKLAQKLGAQRPATAGGNVLRVVSKDAGHGGGDKLAMLERSPSRARPAAAASLLPDASVGPAPSAPPPHWDYAGSAGPAAWGRMNPEYAACTSGSRQSPIDIRDGLKLELDPVRFDYRPSAFRVVDNGHTVQVNVGAGNSIEVGGRRYELLQFHFHRPSEERIDGKQFDMVAHLVHKSAEGRLAVVAVLLERGAAQPIVQSVWNNLPLEKGEEAAARVPLNPADLLPAERRYFTYMGSLTTPPCSEGVLWMVLKQPVQMSPEQESIFAHLYPMNARPVQPSSGRMIKESN